LLTEARLLRSKLLGFLLMAGALLGSASTPALRGEGPDSPQDAVQLDAPSIAPSSTIPPAPKPEPPPIKTVADIMHSGVLITVSLSSQQMHVFRDGVLWKSSPVSTGKRGKRTPTGVFAILQKKRFHRSNLYSNAPMPYMQRLTWGGIAIHAGRLPGYPASHGCIRIPSAFASELFKITDMAATAVIIVDEPLADADAALALAQRSDAVVPITPALLQRVRPALASAIPNPPSARLPASRTIPARPIAAGQQTIQLAATLSPQDAVARWEVLAGQKPELRGMQMAVIPAVVNGKQFYRLRASAPDAHARCKALKRAGTECFAVN
jgi:L,D-transpeptidase catalytic domain/SPOR domain